MPDHLRPDGEPVDEVNVDPMPPMPVSENEGGKVTSASRGVDSMAAAELREGKGSASQRNEARTQQNRRGGY